MNRTEESGKHALHARPAHLEKPSDEPNDVATPASAPAPPPGDGTTTLAEVLNGGNVARAADTPLSKFDKRVKRVEINGEIADIERQMLALEQRKRNLKNDLKDL